MTVKFKVENFTTEPIGPCVITDLDLYEQDPIIAAHKDAGLPGIPFGHKPLGQQTRWMTLSEALAIAAEMGVELEES